MAKFKERPKELIEMIVSIYKETGSAYKCASKTGISPYVAYSILKDNGVDIPSWSDPKPNKHKIIGDKALELIADYNLGIKNDELVKKYGVGREAIKNTIKRAGIKLRDHGGQRRRVTDVEASEIVSLYNKGLNQAAISSHMKCGASVVSRILTNEGLFSKEKLIGENHGSWKGGISKKPDGYILRKIYHTDIYFSMANRAGYVPQHRYVMAQHLGRALTKNETVHHVDGNRENNAIENLQLRQGKHGNGVIMTCCNCGSNNIKTTEI